MEKITMIRSAWLLSTATLLLAQQFILLYEHLFSYRRHQLQLLNRAFLKLGSHFPYHPSIFLSHCKHLNGILLSNLIHIFYSRQPFIFLFHFVLKVEGTSWKLCLHKHQLHSLQVLYNMTYLNNILNYKINEAHSFYNFF